MAKYSVLVNPCSRNGKGEQEAKKLLDIMKNDILTFYNIMEVEDYTIFLSGLDQDEHIILAGGDGTINHFVNDIAGLTLDKDVYYYATGTGNDFLNDIGKKYGDPPFLINQYLDYLPLVTVNGKSYRFGNGIGYGLDGYCCEEADRIHANSDKSVNYAKIALKGLLYAYHPTSAEVTVDGVTHSYRRAWLVPTMFGKFYGGGIMMAPNQNRLNPNHCVTTVVVHDAWKGYILALFPSIFKGRHTKYKKHVDVFEGHEVHVKFDRPVALQIDGETVLGVTEYQVISRVHESLGADRALHV